jgi:preprotein translocase subunit YajC
MNSYLFMAQAAAPAGPGGGIGGMLLPMVVIFAIMYFMMIRPQQRKEKERKAMITDLKTGARVIFGGGIIGTISNVKETTFVIKIADNTKIEVLRAAVSRAVDKGEKIEEDEK